MTDDQKPRSSSGELPAVIALRKKLDSIEEITLPEIAQTIERADVVLATPPPPVAPAPAAPLIGRCRMTLEVVGKHHNRLPEDMDRLFAIFIRTLRANGHQVDHATFVNGDEQNLTDAEKYLAEPTAGTAHG